MCYKKLFVPLFCAALLAACVVQSVPTKSLTQYQQAVAQYEAKKYYKAAQLFEEALPGLQGKNEASSAHFYWAYCSFYQQRYEQSAGRFKYFRKTFPRDPRLEEALYMQAHALYCQSPDVQLDQTFTREAAYLLRSYLQRYPNGAYADKANTQLEELNEKLALQAFKSAQLYYQLGHYQAAVVTLEAFQKDFPLASYNEEAAYLKADAQYRRLQKTPEDEKQQQLSAAMKCCKAFLASYPDSRYTSAIETICNKLSQRQ